MFSKMTEFLQQAKQMNETMQKLQEELAKQELEGMAGAGMVKVRVNGKQEVLSVLIDSQILKAEDKQMVQDLVVAATNDALQLARQKGAEEMQKRMGGLGNLASLFGGG